MRVKGKGKRQRAGGVEPRFRKLYGEGLEMSHPVDDIKPVIQRCKRCNTLMRSGICEECIVQRKREQERHLMSGGDVDEDEDELKTSYFDALVNKLSSASNIADERVRRALAMKASLLMCI